MMMNNPTINEDGGSDSDAFASIERNLLEEYGCECLTIEFMINDDSQRVNLCNDQMEYDVDFEYNGWRRISDAVRNNCSPHAVCIFGQIEANLNPDTSRCIGAFFDGLKQNTSAHSLHLQMFPHNYEHPKFDLVHFIKNNRELDDLKFYSPDYAALTPDQSFMISSALAHVADNLNLDLSECTCDGDSFSQIISACLKVVDLSVNCSKLSEYAAVATLLEDSRAALKWLLLNAYGKIEGISMVLASLATNRTVQSLFLYGVYPNLCIPLLCDTASIAGIHDSNHTLLELCIQSSFNYNKPCLELPEIAAKCLKLNRNPDKLRVIREKILRFYFIGDFDVSPFFSMPISILPEVMRFIKPNDNDDDDDDDDDAMMEYIFYWERKNTVRHSAIFRLLKSIPDLCNVSSRVVTVTHEVPMREICSSSDSKRQKTDTE
eukprot:scaffold5580_cov61-Cyclotella_meneghiniana.AAC.3